MPGNTLMSLAVALGLDSSALHKGLGDAEEASIGTAQRVGTQLASIGKGIVLSGLVAVTATIAGLGKAMVDAIPVEGITAAFEGVTKASGKMTSAVLADLVEGSFGMITNKELMMKYNLAAQLVGDTFANQLPAALGPLGKVAAATGQDMSYMLESLVRGVGRLSPMILDNLGIQVDLVQANEEWAKSSGRTVDSMTQQEQQAALMVQVLAKLEKNTSAMPNVIGTAAHATKKFETTLANLKDTVGLALLPALTGLANTFSKAFADPAVQNAIPVIVAKLGEFATFFVAAIPGIIEGIQNTFGWFAENEGVVVAAIAIISVAVLAFFVSMAAAAWAAIVPLLPLIAVLAAIGVAAYLLYEAWTNNWGGIQEKTAAVVAWIQTAIATFLAAIQAFWTEHGAQIIATVTALWEMIKMAVTVALTFIQTLVSTALAAIMAFWTEHGAAIMAAVTAVWEFIRFTIDNALIIIQAIVAAFIAAFNGDWTAFGEQLRIIWDTLWKQIITVLEGAWEIIKKIVAGLVKSIADFFKNTNWGAIGSGIISGIASGVMAAAGRLIDAAVAAARAALNAVQNFLGIQSPSKLFKMQVGWEMGVGMEEGFIASVARMVRHMPDIMSPIVPIGFATSPAVTVPSNNSDASGSAQPILDEAKLARILRDMMLQVAQ